MPHLVQINQSEMLNKKVLVTFSVTIIYAVLFGLFVYFTKSSHECSYKSPCIHFCSSKVSEYTDQNLINKFMESMSAKDFEEDEVVIKAIRGKPSCGEMNSWLPNDEVNSTKPPYDFNYVSLNY